MSELSDIQELRLKLEAVEQILRNVHSIITKQNDDELDGWVSQKRIQEITGLGKTTLLQLRRKNMISASTIEGKGVWYRKKDFVKLLNKNERER